MGIPVLGSVGMIMECGMSSDAVGSGGLGFSRVPPAWNNAQLNGSYGSLFGSSSDRKLEIHAVV